MEATYCTKAIVLNRRPVNEADVKVLFYTQNIGKIELLARGARKANSKLAAHIEPMNLVDLMVVKGKTYDYVGSVISQKCHLNLKQDLKKIALSGKAIACFNKNVNFEQTDLELFNFIKDFLLFIDEKNIVNHDLILAFFRFKLIKILGLQPNLDTCSHCNKNITLSDHYYCETKQAIVCKKCYGLIDSARSFFLAENSFKVLHWMLEQNFEALNKLTGLTAAEKKQLIIISESLLNNYL